MSNGTCNILLLPSWMIPAEYSVSGQTSCQVEGEGGTNSASGPARELLSHKQKTKRLRKQPALLTRSAKPGISKSVKRPLQRKNRVSSSPSVSIGTPRAIAVKEAIASISSSSAQQHRSTGDTNKLLSSLRSNSSDSQSNKPTKNLGMGFVARIAPATFKPGFGMLPSGTFLHRSIGQCNADDAVVCFDESLSLNQCYSQCRMALGTSLAAVNVQGVDEFDLMPAASCCCFDKVFCMCTIIFHGCVICS